MNNLWNRCYTAFVSFWYGPVTDQQRDEAHWLGWATIQESKPAEPPKHPLLRKSFEYGISWAKFERNVELEAHYGIGAADAFAASQAVPDGAAVADPAVGLQPAS